MPRKDLLARKHEQALIKRIIIICIFCVGMILLVIFYAIPTMVQIADVWDTTRNSNKPNTQSSGFTIPLQKPYFDGVPFSATNSASLTLKGHATTGSTVMLRVNGKDSGSVVADSSGVFTFGDVAMDEGSNSFVVSAKDNRGTKSDDSDPLTITLDTHPPRLDVTAPNNGDTYSGQGQAIVTVKGKTDEATQMYVNSSWVILAPDGSFEYKLQLAPGNNTITMYAMDDAGNKSPVGARNVTFNP